MPLPPSPIGFDSSVLINFGEADCLDLLMKCFDVPGRLCREANLELLTPLTRAAIDRAVGSGALILDQLEPAELPLWVALSWHLGAGEAATIAAAKHRAWSVALDDRVARRIAMTQLGRHRLIGTFGLLIAVVERGVLSYVDTQSLLEAMIANGFWSPAPTLPR